jgi:hypothetical protein
MPPEMNVDRFAPSSAWGTTLQSDPHKSIAARDCDGHCKCGSELEGATLIIPSAVCGTVAIALA